MQLYVAAPEVAAGRSKIELKAFRKVFLKAGETSRVTLDIPASELRRFDADSHSWVSDPGEYTLLAGSSSKDIRAEARFTLKYPDSNPRNRCRRRIPSGVKSAVFLCRKPA